MKTLLTIFVIILLIIAACMLFITGVMKLVLILLSPMFWAIVLFLGAMVLINLTLKKKK